MSKIEPCPYPSLAPYHSASRYMCLVVLRVLLTHTPHTLVPLVPPSATHTTPSPSPLFRPFSSFLFVRHSLIANTGRNKNNKWEGERIKHRKEKTNGNWKVCERLWQQNIKQEKRECDKNNWKNNNGQQRNNKINQCAQRKNNMKTIVPPSLTSSILVMDGNLWHYRR